jgi:hypothetical protein
MKKVLCVFIVILFSTIFSVAQAGQFGPQEPTAKEGGFSVSAGYTYYNGKWKTGGDDYKVTQNLAFIQGSYTFNKLWEAYARVGGANMKAEDIFATGESLRDKTQPFGSIGLKGLLYDTPSFGIGPFFQASYLFGSYKDDRTVVAAGGTGTLDAKWKNQWDISFGLGMQTKINGFILYGGPFLYWAQSTLDYTSTVPGSRSSLSYTFKEKNNVGGFLGLRMPITKKISIDVEGELKNNVAGGIKVNYAF